MSETLGVELRRVREIRGVSLREVEKGTGISNAYLSQLETGKAARPSPHLLHALATYYGVPYDSLMEAAGYLQPPEKVKRNARRKLGAVQAALLSADLTPDEQQQVARFVAFLRSQRASRKR